MGSLAEHNVSYWIESAADAETPHKPPIPARLEVCVVGAGLTGLLTAWQLVQRGVQVAVLEAGRICSGTTGYTTGKVTSQHGARYGRLMKDRGEDVARAYARAQQEGLAMIAELAGTIPCDFTRAPAYVYTEDDERVPELEREARVTADLGLPSTFTTETDLPFDVRGAVRFDDQAWFHPRAFCLGLADSIAAAGGTVVEHARVVGIDGNLPARVQLEDGRVVEAGFVVLATQTPFVLSGAFFARTEPKRSYVIAGTHPDPPRGMYISADDPVRSLRPHIADGGDSLLLIGGGGHPAGRETDTEGGYEGLERFAIERFGLTDVQWRWSAQDFAPADGLPFVGPVTKTRLGCYVATGYDKWGMTNAAAAALAISDSLIGRESPWAKVADAARLGAARSMGTVISQGAQTVKSIVGDRMRMRSADDVESLAPGEGAIVDAGGERVAAFRDDDGTLHAVSPVCTHLGCIVHFNRAERSWDCPCHGSRFGVDGRVISGPATKDLQPKAAGGLSANPLRTGR